MEQETPAPIIRILKIGTCPTLSGKGKLEYHIGHEPNDGICFRMTSSSGGGFFSPEWVSLKAIQAAAENAPRPITSFSLFQLFRGKSVNTPGYLFAALLAEGLVQRDEENPRVYVCCPPDTFLAEIKQLIDAGTDLKVAAKITGKGVVKKGRKPLDIVPVMTKSRGRPKKAKPEVNKS